MLPVMTLPNENLQAIGTFVVRWNHLEAILENVLLRMMGVGVANPRATIVVAGIGFTQRLDVLEALLGWISMEHGSAEPLQTYTQEIRHKLTELQGKRNQIVHARWSDAQGTVKTLNITAKKKLKIKHEEMPLSQLHAINDQISDAANSLYGLVDGKYPYQSVATKGAVAKALSDAMDKHPIAKPNQKN